MTSALVDTNLLVYWIDRADVEKHARAVSWLRKLEPRLGELAVAPQNLREFAAVFWRKKSGVRAREIAEWLDAIESTFHVLEERAEDVKQAGELVEKHGASYWDALLASTMKRNGIRTIFTEDAKDFSKIPGLKVINPLE